MSVKKRVKGLYTSKPKSLEQMGIKVLTTEGTIRAET